MRAAELLISCRAADLTRPTLVSLVRYPSSALVRVSPVILELTASEPVDLSGLALMPAALLSSAGSTASVGAVQVID